MILKRKVGILLSFIILLSLTLGSVNNLNFNNLLYSTSNLNVIALENSSYRLVHENSAWYCYNENNMRCSGWIWIDERNSWFYFSPKTYKMQIGWMQLGNNTYYFNSDGTARKGFFYDKSQSATFYFNKQGKMHTGWLKKKNVRYYFSEIDGKMQTGLVRIKGKDYFFQSNGALRTGWYYDKNNDNYYYYKPTGEASKGWTKIKSKNATYYFSPIDGRMETGLIYVDGERYYLNTENGELMTGSFTVDGVPYTTDNKGKILENVDSLKIDENNNLQFYNDYNDTTPVNAKDGKKGIDISQWQGKDIDWNAIKSSGVEYVMIRSNYGWTGKDLRFDDNIKGAKSAGLKVGVYLYSYATNTDEAKAEFENLFSTIKDYKLDYPVAYDLEDSCQTMLSKTEMTNIATTFCNLVKRAGYKPMIYASTSWLKDRLDYSKISSYYLWVAQYNETCDYPYRNPPDMWQYSSTGSIEGIDGYVDMNCAYSSF